MKGYPLACFNKPWMENGGYELFVCNGYAGVVGARKKSDRSQTVFVRDPDIARNLNLQAARAECTGGKVAVTEEGGLYDFRCSSKELTTKTKARFQTASKADWAKFEAAFRQ
ncbi:MAG TPA: hypothetical protein VHC90_20480 [Bryobacteraceae bacterium]|nr:hypothetical protein [Bryobacteraceae bacterium]